MSKLQEADEPRLKDNLLPFPALMAAPKDPPRPSVLRGFLWLAAVALGLGLIALTLWALFM